MIINELTSSSSDDEKAHFIHAYVTIWNHPENLKYLSYTGQVFPDAMIKKWLDGLTQHSEMRYFFACEQDVIAGILVVKVSIITGYEICGLGVLPAWKHRGIGTKLLDTAIDDAQSRGFKALETIVYTDNIPMLLLTIKKGFQPCRIQINQRYDGMHTVALKKHFQNDMH